MAEEPKPDEIDNDDDELLLDTPLDPDDAKPGDDDEDGEDVLVFGDDSEPQDNDTGLVKHLRAQIKERDKRLAEAASAPRQEAVDPGPEPTLEGCDYDEDKFKAEWRTWNKNVEAAEQRKGQTAQSDRAEQEAWQADLNRYNEGKTKLGFADVDDAEETIKAALTTAQQAVLIAATDEPAKVAYALAKNPERLASIAGEQNLLKLAAKFAKLEGTLKMVKRRRAPDPDVPEKGSGKISRQTSDKKLAKLEEQAAKTGDRTELVKYKKSLKQGK